MFLGRPFLNYVWHCQAKHCQAKHRSSLHTMQLRKGWSSPWEIFNLIHCHPYGALYLHKLYRSYRATLLEEGVRMWCAPMLLSLFFPYSTLPYCKIFPSNGGTKSQTKLLSCHHLPAVVQTGWCAGWCGDWIWHCWAGVGLCAIPAYSWKPQTLSRHGDGHTKVLIAL